MNCVQHSMQQSGNNYNPVTDCLIWTCNCSQAANNPAGVQGMAQGSEHAQPHVGAPQGDRGGVRAGRQEQAG